MMNRWTRYDEQSAEKRERLRMAEGLAEFLGAVAGVAVILIASALLISLLNFLKQDIGSTFTLLKTQFLP